MNSTHSTQKSAHEMLVLICMRGNNNLLFETFFHEQDKKTP